MPSDLLASDTPCPDRFVAQGVAVALAQSEGFEVMGAACNTDAGRRRSRQPALRLQPQERARGPVEADRGDWGRGLAVSVELEMVG
jgi:hypothetical protein